MNIVLLTCTDFSGVGYNICRAIERLTDHKATLVTANDTIFKYRTELKMKLNGGFRNMKPTPEVTKAVKESDVIICKEFNEN